MTARGMEETRVVPADATYVTANLSQTLICGGDELVGSKGQKR